MAAYTTIDDPSAHFQTATYTGNGSTQSITNSGNSNLQPDFAWIKDLGSAFDHKLQDSTRGSTYTLESNTTTAAYNDTDAVTSFNTDDLNVKIAGQIPRIEEEFGFNADSFVEPKDQRKIDDFILQRSKVNGAIVCNTISADNTETKKIFDWEPIPFKKTILDCAKSIENQI